MLIDSYDMRWFDRLDAGEADSEGVHYLLIDGAFVPELHRRVKAVVPAEFAPTLLFEELPSCSDATRDVSPFLVSFRPSNPGFRTVLAACSGWPMVSAIQTPESQSELTQRLAAWCVVEVDGQRFNFRFPDTRRSPCIFNALSPQQKAEFMGPASRWSYIQRDGKWNDVVVPGIPSPTADRPQLDDRQFARLVGDSEADEIISILEHQGYEATGLRSRQHCQVVIALRAASRAALEISEKVAWCEASLAEPLPSDASEVVRQFEKWFASARPNIEVPLS
jgi:hypothetical protein